MLNQSNRKVVIIDYNLGNLFSVKQACEAVGLNAKISSNKYDIEQADALILPGVGAFIEAMSNLEKMDLINPILNSVNLGKPFFGICLGLQLIFSRSEEFGSAEGLNLIPGIIKKFPFEFDNRRIKVPQIAWNKIYQSKIAWSDSPLMHLKQNDYMYFVHSYFVDPTFQDCIISLTNYEGLEYCSSISKNNIFATQFHPEKSGEKGIGIYKNWATLNNLL